MRTSAFVLTLSLAATFVAFAAPPANACAPIQSCIPGCQSQCPPGCGDNVPCCQQDQFPLCLVCDPVDACFPLCTTQFCIVVNDPCDQLALCGPLPGCGDNVPCCTLPDCSVLPPVELRVLA